MNNPSLHRDLNSLLEYWFGNSISPSTLWRWTKQEDDPFPGPTKIGRKNFWRDDIVNAWFERRDAAQKCREGGGADHAPPDETGAREVAPAPVAVATEATA